ncbi:DNA translocase FtsK [Ancylobacter sp. SL191]|uniref:DNA translocase FtsK n=1 Tax=Ancylobacter sp. SL191 TaxID=2995166 RepID=UPI00226EBEEF|nr:DNA translocase FtsK [Ancylobacter sp. SL191]WAC27197.1 DNA translocase FtsK [Ancylobacter sp. SL191]
MRTPARPSDTNESKPSEASESAPRVLSRANPKPVFAPPPPKGAKGVNTAVPVPARVLVPSWLQPFTLPSNTRFTRTPDYLLRKPAPEPVKAEPSLESAALDTTALVPPRPSQTPVLRVPPRKPPLGAIPKPLIAADARRALAAQEDALRQAAGQAAEKAAGQAAEHAAETAIEAAIPALQVIETLAPVAVAVPVATPVVAAPAVPAPAAELTPPLAANDRAATAPRPSPVTAPSSIRQIAGMIQLGWDVPPVGSTQQDVAPSEDVWLEDAEAFEALPFADAYEAPEAADHAAPLPELLAAPVNAAADEAVWGSLAGFDELIEDSLGDATSDDATPEETSVEEAVSEDAPAEWTASVLPSLGGYTVAPAEVSFSWPSFALVPAAEPTPPPAPAPVVAAPVAVIAPVAPAPVAARPAPTPRPAALPDSDTYELPPLDLLAEPPETEPDYELSEEFLDRNSVKLQQVLHDFGVRGEIIDANPGPVVTLYELEPAPGIKSSRVIGLSADIARSMSAVSARVAVVEGRNVIGIELPNQRRETVWLREMLASHEYEAAKAKLAIALGKTIGGEAVIVDLARMPHLLVAGTTGSGKSVAINTMILSLLYRHRPDQCRLIMIDPKMLELSVYEGIPHLLTPVVTDPKKAIVALKWAVREMEERYRKMSRLGVRNIDGFNARVAEAAGKGEIITRTVQKGFDRETGEIIEEEEIMDLAPLPYIVIVVDEMADLMMVAGKEIEGAIQRLAQMARAAGIHLIMATQRPSVDVITGTIKANFPTRISFQVTSKIDSRTILGEMGAEQLLGQGDMLYMAGGGRISRVHGPFVSDQEVERVVEHLKCQARPEYLDEVTAEEEDEPIPDDAAVFDKSAMGEEPGEVYDQAVAVVLRDKKASTSYIQRRLQIGYNRAASIMERMENEGIVGPANHAGKREILRENR